MNRRGARTPNSNISKENEPVTQDTLRKLSDLRRAEVHQSLSREEKTDAESNFMHSAVAHSPNFRKTATASASVLPTTTSMSDRMAPDLYSPLFQLANLNLPRDRVTMNAWNRIFYDTHPIVRNAINLHSSYPISKINITCKSKEIQEFFLEMADRIDLYSVVYGASLEFWKNGESFPYAELDRNAGIWKRITILNPDYIHVKKPAIGDQTIISLRPDASLQRLVNSSNPSDIQMKHRVPKYILDYVKKGQNIPLDNLNISHLKLLSSPYDIRGTSIIVSVYKDLMLYDKLRECYDNQTEIATSEGFKKYSDVIYTDDNGCHYLKENLKILCYNSETKEAEYHQPTNTILKPYNGKMFHFSGEKIDVCVTPNHRMYASKKTSRGWNQYKIIKAEDMSKGSFYRFQSKTDFSSSCFKNINFVDIGDNTIDIDTYLKFAGYVVSEGCIYSKLRGGLGSIWRDNKVLISQQPTSDCYEDIKYTFEKVADIIGRKLTSSIVMQKSGFSSTNPQDIWKASIADKELTLHCIEEFSVDGKTDSYNKKIPRWILNLPPEKQKIMLDALIAGDGSVVPSKYKNGAIGYRYNTVSRQLADDIYEMAYKCGFTPNINITTRPDRDFEEYTVLWSDGNYGDTPLVYGNPNHGGANINEVDYDGDVWCFEVPTGLFVTRRNGKVTIQGNSKFAQADGMVNPLTLVKLGGSNDYRPTQADIEAFKIILEEAQYDKDFKIITHDGVTIERAGFSGSVLDIAADIELINNNIYTGLMTPKALMDQEGVCMSVDDNEILTERGWLYYDDLISNDKIATVVPETGELKFHKPTFTTDFEFTGMMFRFKNQEVDIETTDFHEMFLSRNNGVTFNKERALSIFDINDINSNKDFTSKPEESVRFKTSIDLWKGKDAPEVIKTPCKNGYSKEILIGDYLEYLGYYLSDNYLKYKDIKFEFFAEDILSGYKEGIEKHIPESVKQFSKENLEILLKALVLKNSTKEITCCFTVSKQLADDIQEIAFKCKYATKITLEKIEKIEKQVDIYKIIISKQNELEKTMPIIKPTDASVRWVNNYRVFCVEVPNHVFVTRSNGKIAIHGNTYASSSVGLEVLRQRYDIFRNMLKKWLEQKIFAPICEIQGFFEYVDGKQRLVVPQVDFNHMNLYDMNDYIQNISNFVSNNQVSLQTLYRSLGLSKEEEDRRLKEELIANVIRQKEEQTMNTMRLAELRNLDADSAITEPPDKELPGLQGGGGEDMGGIPGVGGGGGLDLGGLPAMGGGEAPDLSSALGGGAPAGGAGPGGEPTPT